MQRRVLGLAALFVGIGAGFEQKLDDVRAAVVNRAAQKGVPVLVVEVDTSESCNYKVFDDLRLIDLDGSPQLL